MVNWALLLLIAAILTGTFGFGNTASAISEIAQLLFFVCYAGAVITLVIDLLRDNSRPTA